MDVLYPKIDFSSPAFAALRARSPGDGGLEPGRLVFAEDLARFPGAAGRPLAGLVSDLAGGAEPVSQNVGGPSIVALIHAAQMLEAEGIEVEFHGARGDDDLGERLAALVGKTPVGTRGYRRGEGATPSTLVLSDPRWDGGRGERCFINEIGAAAGFLPRELGPDFFGAGLVAFGGTGLTPGLHDGLPGLLSRARAAGALSVVNTVFDFRNEHRDPKGPWPLGPASDGARPGPRESYANCDLLIADRDEALRLSGERELGAAFRFFQGSGLSAFLVTMGGENVTVWAGGGRFKPFSLAELPVSALASRRLREELASGTRSGDTTGCGDAFAGGVIADLALQAAAGKDPLDLVEAAGWGIAGGAATLFVLGGTYYEKARGEKRAMVEAFHEDWLRQTGRA
jgi:sugar/nucleoside kinase (ribokinase family)